MYSSGSAALALFGAGQAEADDGEVRRQHAVLVQVIDSRQQLAPGQVAVAAEDDEQVRLRQQRDWDCAMMESLRNPTHRVAEKE